MSRWLTFFLLFTGIASAAPVITEFMAGNGSTLVDGNGNYPDWIEVHNPDDVPLDLAGFSLTDGDGVWTFPDDMELAAGGYLIVFASQAAEPDHRDASGGLHATFALSLDGEPVQMLAPGGDVISGFEKVPEQRRDVSYGIDPATGNPVYFALPTPRAANGAGIAGFVEPVAFSVARGFKDDTFNLTLTTTTPGADIFYSLDGSDPGALKVSETLIDSTLVTEDGPRTAYVPAGADDGLQVGGKAWNTPDFVEPVGWISGKGPVGFDSTVIPGDYTGLITFDLGEQMRSKNASALVRIPFQLSESEAADADFLQLSVKYDDGFVAYINGVKVAAANAPVEPNGESVATTSHRDRDAIVFEDFDAASAIAGLRAGQNILAIHAMNASASGSDFFNAVRLTASRYESTAISGIQYTEALSIDGTANVRAIAKKAGFADSPITTQTYIFANEVIRQPALPEGFPATWGEFTGTNGSVRGAPVPADYEMKPSFADGDPEGMVAALKALPTLSIVMDPDDLFSNEGILPNPFAGVDGRTGVFKNKPFVRDRNCSAEWIDPNGGPELQIDCGIRISGGWSRHYSATPKKSFSLLFKEEFGPSRLQFKLFPGSELEEFDRIVLKAIFSNAWPDAAVPPDYLRDHFLRVTLEDMGRKASDGTWVHLYLNGLYWGIYNPTERPDASYAASHYGGDKEDYDAVKHASVPGPGVAPTNQHETIDGTNAAWREAIAIARRGLEDPANYAEFARYVDLGNLADYIILNTFSANVDWPHKNWYANRRRADGEGWKFYPWDSEYALQDSGAFLTGVNNADTPAYLYDRARRNAEFRQLFGDRVHRHLFNGGALTPEANKARYSALAAIIEPAITAEAARWGDNGFTRQGRTNYTKRNWETARDGVIRFFDRRTPVALTQYKRINLYPRVEAPAFNLHGGAVPAGFTLTMTSADSVGGRILYTTDGSDPRVPQTGEATPETLLVTETAALQWYVPLAASDGFEANGTRWTDPSFAPVPAWTNGTGPVGFEGVAGGFNDIVNTNLLAAMRNVSPAVLLRFPFEIDTNALEAINLLKLRVKYDDGFVAFVNGIEVAQANAPVNRDGTAPAVTSHSDSAAVIFEEFDASAAISSLRAGRNVLAILGLNVSVTGSDFLLGTELAWASDLSISPSARVYDGAVPLGTSATVRSRLLKDDAWSALNEAYFQVGTIPASADNVAISRIHYRPTAPSEAEIAAGFSSRSDFEYIAILNRSDTRATLDSLRFVDGISFEFGSGTANDLAPGEQKLLVGNVGAFVFRFGASSAIVGQFSGNLSDGGEDLRMLAADGSVIAAFTYDDKAPWPEAADGDGSALELIDPSSKPDSNLGENWRAVAPAPPQPPGGAAFSAWMDARGVTDPNANDTRTGEANMVVFALGYDLSLTRPVVTAGREGFEYRWQIREESGFSATPESSADLANWSELPKGSVISTANGNGTRSLSVLPAGIPLPGDTSYFRLRIVEAQD
ncbi:MAG: CotH kinase family protein [Verrucomicrobia bacterium]|nr:CotH kinase family protein [Verrucomicrobiota bacterium]